VVGSPSQIQGTARIAPCTKDHVILTNYDPVTINLTEKLRQHHYEYVIVVEDVQQALELQDLSFRVVLGDMGDPLTYGQIKAMDAALVVTRIEKNNGIIASIPRVIYFLKSALKPLIVNGSFIFHSPFLIDHKNFGC
jgi:hypothetical protein